MPVETLVVMAIALGAGGLVKGATGMGLPLIALPVLASFLGVADAVALMSPCLVLTNVWQVWRFRADLWTADFLPGLLVAGAVGIAVGTVAITSLPERYLSLALSFLLLFYIGLRLAKPSFAISRPAGRRLAPAAGFGAGVLQGATGISSPIGVTFIHALRLSRSAHVFSVSAMFLLFSVVQVPALAVAGVLTWELFVLGLLAVVPAFATMPVGAWLAGRLSQAVFDRMILALLAIIGVQLMVKALGGD